MMLAPEILSLGYQHTLMAAAGNAAESARPGADWGGAWAPTESGVGA